LPIHIAVHGGRDLFEQNREPRIAVCGDVAQRIPEFFFHAYVRYAFANRDWMFGEHGFGSAYARLTEFGMCCWTTNDTAAFSRNFLASDWAAAKLKAIRTMTVKSGSPVTWSAPDAAIMAAAIVAVRPKLTISFPDKGIGPIPLEPICHKLFVLPLNRLRCFD
jgi:hypothetical protein